jgi:hypothetical protein
MVMVMLEVTVSQPWKHLILIHPVPHRQSPAVQLPLALVLVLEAQQHRTLQRVHLPRTWWQVAVTAADG